MPQKKGVSIDEFDSDPVRIFRANYQRGFAFMMTLSHSKNYWRSIVIANFYIVMTLSEQKKYEWDVVERVFYFMIRESFKNFYKRLSWVVKNLFMIRE